MKKKTLENMFHSCSSENMKQVAIITPRYYITIMTDFVAVLVSFSSFSKQNHSVTIRSSPMVPP